MKWDCDKCRKPVPLGNDALALDTLFHHGRLPNPMTRCLVGARHLVAVEGCEGSPSRAQYLPGQPQDDRGYHYVEANEAGWREALRRLGELETIEHLQ